MDNLRSMDGKTVTVTGCVSRQAATAGAAAERGTSEEGFLLTNVQLRTTSPSGTGTTGAPSTPSTPSTPGMASGSSNDMSLKLVNSDESKISANVNKQVEVTGRLEVEDSMGRSGAGATRPGTTGTTPSTPPPSGGTTPSTGGTSRMGMGAHGDVAGELHVSSIRVLNQSCTP